MTYPTLTANQLAAITATQWATLALNESPGGSAGDAVSDAIWGDTVWAPGVWSDAVGGAKPR